MLRTFGRYGRPERLGDHAVEPGTLELVNHSSASAGSVVVRVR
jgi:hypothetical protein